MDLMIAFMVLVGLSAAGYIAFRIRKAFKKAECDSCCASCERKCERRS